MQTIKLQIIMKEDENANLWVKKNSIIWNESLKHKRLVCTWKTVLLSLSCCSNFMKIYINYICFLFIYLSFSLYTAMIVIDYTRDLGSLKIYYWPQLKNFHLKPTKYFKWPWTLFGCMHADRTSLPSAHVATMTAIQKMTLSRKFWNTVKASLAVFRIKREGGRIQKLLISKFVKLSNFFSTSRQTDRPGY